MDVEKEFKEHFNYDKGKGKEPKKIRIKKYSGNGSIPLHESVIIGGLPKFVYLDKDKKPKFVDFIPRVNDVLIPDDTIDTQNPIPFIFESEQDFQSYLDRSKDLDLETLFNIIESINRKYVDVEDHYHVLFTADMIWTWLQDKFGYTHYNILIGDNGSGKNSQLLVFKFLGYRVFYVVSASAPNYYTKMGNKEEGQITIAEDEAEDIAEDREKRNVFKSGYCSGASVPKVELEGGRKTDDWLTYCQKWVSMEELPNNKDIKGILDRSFVHRFVTGNPEYNIKDVIRSAGDPEFKPLYDELMDTRKLSFCWRLIHYYDPILDIKLNVKNRGAELTKPLIRLFQNSPIALEKILASLSEFMVERREVKQDSFESKLYETIEYLIKERKANLDGKTPLDDEITLGYTKFTNEGIRNILKDITEGEDVPDKQECFYSSLEGIGLVTQTKITRILKSKFKVKTPRERLSDKKMYRCIEFNEKYLKRIKSNYDTPSEIRIIKPVTLVTDVTLCRGVLGNYADLISTKILGNTNNLAENHEENNEKPSFYPLPETAKTSSMSQESVTSVTTVTNLNSVTKSDSQEKEIK